MLRSLWFVGDTALRFQDRVLVSAEEEVSVNGTDSVEGSVLKNELRMLTIAAAWSIALHGYLVVSNHINCVDYSRDLEQESSITSFTSIVTATEIDMFLYSRTKYFVKGKCNFYLM